MLCNATTLVDYRPYKDIADICKRLNLTYAQVFDPVMKKELRPFEPQCDRDLSALPLNSPLLALWRASQASEDAKLRELGVYSIIKRADMPKGMKTLGTRWVLKTVWFPSGELNKLKARLVVQGFTQRPGINYDLVYSATPGLGIYRLFIAISAWWNWCSF